MSDYYSATGFPGTGALIDSSPFNNEYASIDAGFAKVVPLTGNNDLPVFVNSAGSAQEALSVSSARTKLGVAIGVDVQAYSTVLDTYGGIAPSANVQSLLGAADYATFRTNLGAQAYSSVLDTYAGITPSADIQSLLGSADYATARTNLGVAINTDVQSYSSVLDTYAGITPSSNVQTFLGSADYAAMRALLGPEGYVGDTTMVFVPLTTAQMSDQRRLLLDGTPLSRTTYADLFALWGTSFGEGDGTTTFGIPAMQGLYPRGVDGGAGVDPDAAARTAQNTGGNAGDLGGSVQDDDLLSHLHSVPFLSNSSNAGAGNYIAGCDSGGAYSANSALTGGNETRGKNIYVYWYVRY